MIFHDSIIYTISIISSGIALVFSTITHLYFLVPINDVSSKMKLLLKEITHKLAVKGKEWRAITYNMNQYIFDQVLQHTWYHFYSQRDCHIYFSKQFREEPSGGKRNHRPAMCDYTSIEYFTFSPGPNHERCLFKAAKIGQQSQQNHLKEQYPAATQCNF